MEVPLHNLPRQCSPGSHDGIWRTMTNSDEQWRTMTNNDEQNNFWPTTSYFSLIITSMQILSIIKFIILKICIEVLSSIMIFIVIVRSYKDPTRRFTGQHCLANLICVSNKVSQINQNHRRRSHGITAVIISTVGPRPTLVWHGPIESVLLIVVIIV